MTATLGKRKRRAHIEGAEKKKPSERNEHQLQQLLRQHFETRFEPIKGNVVSEQKRPYEEDAKSDVSDSDWVGFPEDEEEAKAFIVDYQNLEKTRADVSRENGRLFMSAKPPSKSTGRPSTSKRIAPDPADPEDAATDAANLKKDLALQRLLGESHLLESTSSLAPLGQNRHKALDIRQQGLGSKSSMYYQKNMPLAQRKGILAKAVERDEDRRREAKENGIILEKTTKSKSRDPKRQREIGVPTIGRFSRGMLTLSKKDVTDIVGRPKQFKRRWPLK